MATRSSGGWKATDTRPDVPASGGAGPLVRHWRNLRNLSQLRLALEAGVSPRHLCFVETGRARPSREMVLRLAQTLEVPLRDRNALLLAAGFAPGYREQPLDAAELAPVQAALDAILRQQEPYPAVVMNRSWDVTRTNAAADRFFGFLLDGATGAGPANVVRMMLDPAALRPRVTNWEAVAEALIGRIHREAVGRVPDEATTRLLDEILAFPGVREIRDRAGTDPPLVPVIPVCFARDGRTFNYFSTVTTLGTPQDVTLQELRIECFFPLDAATEANARALAAEDSGGTRAG